jgi:hypothetical protein
MVINLWVPSNAGEFLIYLRNYQLLNKDSDLANIILLRLIRDLVRQNCVDFSTG